MIAGLAEAVGVAALYRGLAVGSMSIVAPVAATAPVVPVLAGIALGEPPTAPQGGGIVLAIAGVTMISLVPPGRRSTRNVGPSLLFGLLTALGFGGFLAAMDGAPRPSRPSRPSRPESEPQQARRGRLPRRDDGGTRGEPELVYRGVAELRGERLRRGEPDAHAVADGGDRDDLDRQVVLGRAGAPLPAGASAISHG